MLIAYQQSQISYLQLINKNEKCKFIDYIQKLSFAQISRSTTNFTAKCLSFSSPASSSVPSPFVELSPPKISHVHCPYGLGHHYEKPGV